MNKEKFYVTTPIYYATARPHLGSLYSTVMADVTARWNKLCGKKTFFLTGTDEHGQKIAQAAQKVSKTPKEFVESFIVDYKKVWNNYELDYNDFIRTTDERHKKAVQYLIKVLQAKGDIYKGKYEGWYCVSDEAYLTETDYDASVSYNPDSGPECPVCKRPTKLMKEEGYFFKLSAYQDKLLDFYKNHPDFIAPRERSAEVVNFVKSGLRDLSISRTSTDWGIPFPSDEKHVCYVWIDALTNYISAIGYAQRDKQKDFNFWWPADLHILGKDIVRFHAVYWPAFLMAAELELPKRLLVHGWITVCGDKMSKSKKNVVDPQELYAKYGPEPVRYYLLRHMSISQDGDFCISSLEKRITCDLANDLGNLVNRMLTLAKKNGLTDVPQQKSWSEKSINLRDKALSMISSVEKYMENYLFHMALAEVMKFVSLVNAYFHAHEPWKLAKNDMAAFVEVVSAVCHSLHQIAHLLWPVMPTKMSELLKALGIVFVPGEDVLENIRLNNWNEHFTLTTIAPLFEKPVAPPEDTVKPIESEKKVEQKEEKENHISIDQFADVELRVGTIEECKEVPKSEKLLQMSVNFGVLGVRTVLAGVKKWYKPEDLIGIQAVFVCNLKPRKIMGIPSQGMMLFSESADGKLYYTKPAGKVENGERLR